MIILEHEQGSQEWLDSRIGVLTGTRIAKIVTPAKLNLSTGHVDMLDRLLDENITGISSENEFSTLATERGNLLENKARLEYINKSGININTHGLCLSDIHNLHGCSPDGFTDDFKGCVEIKCPGFIHLKYSRENIIPSTYKLQVLNYFIVNEKLEWLDFVSYRPEFYLNPISITRVTRVELQPEISKLEHAINTFFANYYKLRDSYLF